MRENGRNEKRKGESPNEIKSEDGRNRRWKGEGKNKIMRRRRERLEEIRDEKERERIR